nr:hypothetical protein [Tanacetum cinerariifolium]
MVRDNVQLETAVNTIAHEYLLEFTSEYGIPEALRPELPRPEDRIVDFPEGKAWRLTNLDVTCGMAAWRLMIEYEVLEGVFMANDCNEWLIMIGLGSNKKWLAENTWKVHAT